MVPSIKPVQNHEHANRTHAVDREIETTVSMMSIWSLPMPATTPASTGTPPPRWWQPARNAGRVRPPA